MLLTLKKGTPVFIGSQSLALPSDIEFEIPGNYDAVAQMLAHAGQKVYGDHVGALAHTEKLRRDGKDKAFTVTYGPGGARIETELIATEE